MNIKRIMSMAAALIMGVAAFAQPVSRSGLIEWTSSANRKDDNTVQVLFTGKIADGHHTYPADHKFSPTEIIGPVYSGCSAAGAPYTLGETVSEIGADGEAELVFIGKIVLSQDIVLQDDSWSFKGTILANACSKGACQSEYYDFEVTSAALQGAVKTGKAEAGNDETVVTNAPSSGVSSPSTASVKEDATGAASVWALILEAILWGFAMLLTPCVFPMVPMTVSFFMKGSSSPAQGRMKALLYGFFIVLLYTVPISLIILITRVVGGDAVTADIFNWLATHWLPNLIFFVVFMIFAASFFGAFEISLPQSLVNKSDKGADKGGIIGIFFMALTLVLVSFSCTGPIVGTVLIKSTQGEFWTPMVTMLAFSVAFALPFTVLALFPSLLKKFRQSGGGWLNSVKVVLGFVEIALGFKFLSVADQTYHWGILDREVYLAIWIVTFSLLGLYLLGKIRFANDDEPVERLSVTRLSLAIAVFTFVVYMIPGMFGAPLKALSGYLPPITTQDFVIGKTSSSTVSEAAHEDSFGSRYDLHLPLGLDGYFSLDEGLAAAKISGKPAFVDITGHGCVNCREMESRVWSDSQVLQMLKNEFVIVALYTDDKSALDERDWVVAENGEVYKQLGRANSYIARTLFNVNAQPNYVLLSPEGKQLVPTRGYDLSISGFVEFLQSGLDAMKK